MTYIGPQSAAERRRIEIEQAIARTGLISGAMAETGCTYNEARAVWNEMLGETGAAVPLQALTEAVDGVNGDGGAA
jgi:molybdenum-dependent DNA-binding transcriptional regulator ModE